MPNVGDPAPLFSGVDILTGDVFSLSEHSGKCVLVAFHGVTWCGPCQFAVPLLQEVWAGYQQAGSPVQFVVVSVEEDPEPSLLQGMGITMPWLARPGIPPLYEVGNAVPKYFFLDHDLTITHVQNGLFSSDGEEQKNGIRGHIDECLPPTLTKWVHALAIDPLALLLRPDIYVKLTLPDPPPIDVFVRQAQAALDAMSPRERAVALSRIRAFSRGLEALQRELGEAPRSRESE